ncbi:MAG: undecaprenyl-phosphate glucose phosphotransferase [Owenweeksia sp.]
MQSRYALFFQFIIIVGDLLLLNGCFALALALRFDEIPLEETDYYDYYLQLVLFFNVSWLLLTFAFKTHDTRRTLEPRKATSKVLNVYFLHIFLLLLVLVSLKRDVYSRLFLIYFYSALLITILPWRFFFIRLLRSYRKRGISFRKVVLVGNGQDLNRFYEAVNRHPEYGLRIGGYYSDKPVSGIPLSGPEAALKELGSGSSEFDELYCAYQSEDERIMEWFKWADRNLVRFRVIPNLGIRNFKGVEMDFYHDVPVLVHRKEPLEYLHNRWTKRLGDIIFSLLIILTICTWLFPLLAIIIKATSRGPVFFKQKRTGLHNDEFVIYKFRSMRPNDEAHEKQATAGDQRLTVFGRFIRQFNLDELPQFFNVLKGEMSVVGPRPHMIAHTREYNGLMDRYMVRHFAKPGITGLAQINGLRGEVTSTADIEERVKTDVYYIENWSVLLDIKIILTTIYQSLIGKTGRA